MTNARRLREFRRARGLRQSDFGTRIGAGESTVACWETGARSPSLTMAAKIEVATGGFVRAVDWARSEPDQGPQAA